MVATVGTAMTARISAGMIVQPISSTVLPWICFGLRSSPGCSRNRSATKIVAPTTPMPMTTAIQKNGVNRSWIFWASGPFGSSEFWPLSLPAPQPASTADRGEHRGADDGSAAEPCMRSNICLPRPWVRPRAA